MLDELPDAALRLLAAMLAGVVGWEREWKDKAAGLRTHMLVSLGSALFMVCAVRFAELAAVEHPSQPVDPMRVLQGIAGGVGFLGAGAILRTRGSVHGLTTAATIWIAASLGVACGTANYGLAVLAVVFVLTTLVLFGVVERIVFPTSGKESDSPETAEPGRCAATADRETPEDG